MLSIKLLDDYLIKSQDIKTFKIQLLRDATPYALTDDCTCTLLIANKNAIVVEEEMAIIDASQGIVEFTLHATIGTGNFDCEFLVSNGNDIHLTFPDSGYTVLKISDCLSDRPIQVITPSEYANLNERMDGFIDELEEFEQSVTTTIDGFEVTLGTMQTQINNSINTMNSNFATLQSGIEEQMVEMEELVGTVVDPMELTLVNDNNNFSVGVDNNGTKYDVIESSESTIELNGRTLVNLWGKKREDFHFTKPDIITYNEDGSITAKAENGSWVRFSCTNINQYKTNTYYTVIANVTTNTLDDACYLTSSGGIFEEHKSIPANSVGEYVFYIRTKSDFANCESSLRPMIKDTATQGEITLSVIILEGDYTNVPIEYFEGLQSSKPTEIKSVGKNLFNLDEVDIRDDFESTNLCVKIENGFKMKKSYSNISYYKNNLQPNTTYTISLIYTCSVDSHDANGCLYLYNPTTNLVFHMSSISTSNGFRKNTFTTPHDISDYTELRIYGEGLQDVYSTITNIQIEKGTEATNYEPYKESVVTLPNIESLRGLPNGVCDEVFIHDDKLVITRKNKEIILNGSENWALQTTQANTSVFFLDLGNKTSYDVSSDKFTYTGSSFTFDVEGITMNGNPRYLFIAIQNSKLTSLDLTGFKKWLSNNNTTIVYSLAEHVYEWYELPSPHLYKNGHVFIDSCSVPLTSTSHNVDLSLRSAIDTNVEEIVQIKNELNELDMTIATDVTELVNLIKDGE